MCRVQKIFFNVHWSVLFCGSTFCARAGFCVVSTLRLLHTMHIMTKKTFFYFLIRKIATLRAQQLHPGGVL